MRQQARVKRVRTLADMLSQKMNNKENTVIHKLYLRAFWELPENIVWTQMELALEYGDNPPALLTHLLNKELRRRKL